MIFAEEEELCGAAFGDWLAYSLFPTLHFHLLDAVQLWTGTVHTAFVPA